MKAYTCSVCDYVYDDQSAEKTVEGLLINFLDLDPDWLCPLCGVKQDMFEETYSDRVPDIPNSEQ